MKKTYVKALFIFAFLLTGVCACRSNSPKETETTTFVSPVEPAEPPAIEPTPTPEPIKQETSKKASSKKSKKKKATSQPR